METSDTGLQEDNEAMIQEFSSPSSSDIVAFSQPPVENSNYHTVMGILCNLEELEKLDSTRAHITKIQLMEMNLALVMCIQNIKQ